MPGVPDERALPVLLSTPVPPASRAQECRPRSGGHPPTPSLKVEGGPTPFASRSPVRRPPIQRSIGREGNDVKSEGTVKGADITRTMKRTTPNGEFMVVYKGMVDGKTMSGTSETPMGAGEWKAERIEWPPGPPEGRATAAPPDSRQARHTDNERLAAADTRLRVSVCVHPSTALDSSRLTGSARQCIRLDQPNQSIRSRREHSSFVALSPSEPSLEMGRRLRGWTCARWGEFWLRQAASSSSVVAAEVAARRQTGGRTRRPLK